MIHYSVWKQNSYMKNIEKLNLMSKRKARCQQKLPILNPVGPSLATRARDGSKRKKHTLKKSEKRENNDAEENKNNNENCVNNEPV